MTCDAAHVIILSFFDGIGSGPFVFKELFGRPKAVFSWEIDQLCMNVSSYHVPETQHRGDVAADSPAALAAEILALDPDKTARILILGGPPCPDFSSIKAQPAGRAGPEGMKFDQMCDFCDRLEQLLNDWPPFWFLVENVVLKAKGEIQHFSARLKCQPILADAADFGVVSRPRLWWMRRRWSTQDVYPGTTSPLRWTKSAGVPRLQTSMKTDDPSYMQVAGLAFHKDVLAGSVSLPCLTTPAPWPSGRSAPRSSKGRTSPQAHSRWLGDSRRFAPWHYESAAMMTDAAGRYHVLPPLVKERLHHYPDDYTAHPHADVNDRHRMLGNSWHLGVVRLLLLLLLASQVQPHAAQLTRSPTRSALQRMIEWSLVNPAPLGPTPDSAEPPLVPPCAGMREHWALAQRLIHPSLRTQPPEPALVRVTERLLQNLATIRQLRRAVLDELAELVQEWAEITEDWLAQVAPHIRDVYTQGGREPPAQIPLLCFLLRRMQYPGVEELSADLHHGFVLLGQMHAGLLSTIVQRQCASVSNSRTRYGAAKIGEAPDFCNGWGFVARIENQTFYAMGEVPQHVVAAFGHRKGASETLTPEDIEVDWLGGYWKLPSADMTPGWQASLVFQNSNLVRERIISQAKTGTAPVKPYILTEIYAALSAALQQLFGAAEFTSARLAEQYRSQPELAAYLTARCAMSMREPEQRLQGLRSCLSDVERSTMRFTSSPAKSCVQSFVHRAHGEHFDKAIEVYPTNSNALSLLGICALELGQLQRALILMNKSLLLDSDFRAPYVNLGVAYLRLAVSEEGEKAQDLGCFGFFPAKQEAKVITKTYGVACAQLFFLERDPLTPAAAEFRRRSRQELLEARRTDWQEAQARGTARKQQAPWLSVDDKTLQAVEAPMPPAPKPIKLPEYVGWRLFFWRV
ncbi:unnamed protein product [Effrenium voratum]|nr:unnamed protein product [Effrenium voratum]